MNIENTQKVKDFISTFSSISSTRIDYGERITFKYLDDEYILHLRHDKCVLLKNVKYIVANATPLRILELLHYIKQGEVPEIDVYTVSISKGVGIPLAYP